MLTQKEIVINHIERYGSITPLEALTRYGIMRLASRVNDLRNEGWCIQSTMKQHDGRKYASYSMGSRQLDAFATVP